MQRLKTLDAVRLSGLFGICLGIVILTWPSSTPPRTEPTASYGGSVAALGDDDDPGVAELNPKAKALARIVEAGIRELDMEMAKRALKAIPAADQTNALSFALNELKDQRFFEADPSSQQSTDRPLRFIEAVFDILKSLDESQFEAKARWGSFLALERAKLGVPGAPSVSEIADICIVQAEKMPSPDLSQPNPLLAWWDWISQLVLPTALGGLGIVVSKLLATTADEIAKAYVKATFVAKNTDRSGDDAPEQICDGSNGDLANTWPDQQNKQNGG